MKKYLLPLLLLAGPAFAAQQEITAVPDSPVLPSIGALKDAVNLRLADIDENFDEIYPIIEAGPVYVNASAPADTKVVWIDTDQDNAIKAYIGGVWTVVGTAGSGDDLGSAAYADVVALWTTCTGYLKSDGTCDTPSGSATYPSAAGVANWDGSAWGTSYTVGTAANNLVQLNGSAQLPAVSGALLTNIPMPAWLPSAAPTADNMIIQATGGCSDAQYTYQAACEGNSGTWTPPVGAWTSIIDGLINDAGTGTDDLLSASEIDTRISSAGAFYQVADGDLDTAAGADTAGNSKLFGTNASGVVGWYDIPVDTDTDDQTASEVGFTPNGSIAATTVQAAVQEVRDEAEPRVPATLNLTTDTSITAQQLLDNRYISNQGASGEVDITLPAVSYSISRTVLITEPHIVEINPPSGEAFDLNGTDLDADDCIDSPATVKAKAVFTRMQDDTGAWVWSMDRVRGDWVDTGASDD